MKKGKLLLPPNFTVRGEFLNDFITAFPYPAHVKDITDGTYLLSNTVNVQLYGFHSIEQFIGLTVHDLNQKMQPWWRDEYAKQVAAMDQYVRNKKQPTYDNNRKIVTNDGFIRIQNMVKIPVTNHCDKILAIFTFSEDLTHTTNLFHLFNLYRKNFSNKRMAIQQFIKYLNIDKFFEFSPTEAEIFILLAMIKSNSHKYVAKVLCIEPKTVEMHVRNMKNKLRNGNLAKLLMELRNGWYS